MLKLTSMNNTLPPINTHARSSLDDLRCAGTGGTTESLSVSKRQQQQTIDQQRRNPLRTNRLLPTNTNKYTAASPTVAPAIISPFASASPLIRSPSNIQAGSPPQHDHTKTVYRSSDALWNDHQNNTHASNPQLRSNSPVKNKLAVLSQRLSNGTIHENTPITSGKPTLQIPSSPQQQQHTRDELNNRDLLLLPSTGKSYHAIRRRHTNSFLDKAPGPTNYSASMRKEIDRSQFLNNGMRPRQISSKQRNYVNSKTSFYEINEKDMYAGGTLDTNTHQMNAMITTQRLYDSSFDLTANKKPLSPSKSRSFNVPANGLDHYNSTQDVHGNETNNDRIDFAHFGVHRRTSKEQIQPTPKYRHKSDDQTVTTEVVAYTPGQRHPSAQTYESRDPNVSYAYNNVQKYIEENALMSPEKEQIIQNWINDVEKNRQYFQKIE